MAQMPEEGRKFGIVDRNWRDIMGTAVQDSHAWLHFYYDVMITFVDYIVLPRHPPVNWVNG